MKIRFLILFVLIFLCFNVCCYAKDELLPTDKISPIYSRDNCIIVTRDNKKGLYNIEKEKFMLLPIYDVISFNSVEGNELWTIRKNGKYGSYDSLTRQFVLPIEYDGIDYILEKEPLFLVKKGKKKYFCNIQGEKIKKSVFIYNIKILIETIIALPMFFLYCINP